MNSVINGFPKRKYVTRREKQRALFLLCLLSFFTIAPLDAFSLKERDLSFGNGNFGKWILDQRGLPAYRYLVDQWQEAFAPSYRTVSRKYDQHLHWHQIGNFRINALAFNDGFVQLFSGDRVPKWINYFDEKKGHYAGGFGYVQEGNKIWSTLYRDRPKGSVYSRVFGMGYFRKTIRYDNLALTHRISAPLGNDPVLLSTVTIQNLASQKRQLAYWEFWDVNIHQLLFARMVSGRTIKSANRQRYALNAKFLQKAHKKRQTIWVETHLLEQKKEKRTVTPLKPISFDPQPDIVFLSSLDAVPEAFVVSDEAFFGKGGREKPDALLSDIAKPLVDNAKSAKDQPFVLALKRRLALQPGEKKTLRFLFGYAPKKEMLSLVQRFRVTASHSKSTSLWEKYLVSFRPPREAWLQREMAWHAYYLLSSLTYERYFQNHLARQGSAYLYLQGIDGAPRDFIIFAVPMIYLYPSMAKEMLRVVAGMIDKEGKLYYAVTGSGMLTDAVIHKKPSDLYGFFFLGLAEYLLATRDFAFLQEQVPYYPAYLGKTGTILQRVRDGFRYLAEEIGKGSHGLSKAGTGDWSDAISFFAPDRSAFLKDGESVLSTALDAWAFPKIAAAIKNSDKVLSQKLIEQAEDFTAALKKQWNGKWYYRAWDGKGLPIGDKILFSDHHGLLMLAGVPTKKQASVLIHSLDQQLDNRSPIGTLSYYPPVRDPFQGMVPSEWDTFGGVWAASNAWLTWGYALYDTERAWRSFTRNTLAQHAESYPNLWFGIWSGPDGYNAPFSPMPGSTWANLATPMIDFPIMNNNAHAAPLLALIKLAGIQPTADGFRIDPHFPFPNFSLNFPLLGITYRNDTIFGYYRSIVDTTIRMSIRLSHALQSREHIVVKVRGQEVSATRNGAFLTFPLRTISVSQTSWTIEGK